MLNVTQNGDIAYICLKVFENGSLYCNISSCYLIFLSKSFLKSKTLKKERGGALFGGGCFLEKNTVCLDQDEVENC